MALIDRGLARLGLVARLARVGSRTRDQLRIAALVLASPLLRRIDYSRAIPLKLDLDGMPVNWIASTDADLLVVDQIFAGAEYDVTNVKSPGVIVDLGSHVGASVLYFARSFPNARIIAVEPDPSNFRKLSYHVGGLSNVELFNVAVTATDGDVTFFEAGDRDSWASSLRQSENWQKPIQVPSQSLDRLLADLGVREVDLLKIDIEGAEYEVLSNFRGLPDVNHIVGEVHTHLMDCSEKTFRGLLDDFSTDLPDKIGEYQPFSATRIQPSGTARPKSAT